MSELEEEKSKQQKVEETFELKGNEVNKFVWRKKEMTLKRKSLELGTREKRQEVEVETKPTKVSLQLEEIRLVLLTILGT